MFFNVTLFRQSSSHQKRGSMEENLISNIHQYPPGIRFHPSDEELIAYYLERKVKSLPLPANVITDIELYSYNPWDLPRKTLFGEDEWYFFTPRDRKYPNGERPNRTAASGYWKATGTDKPILSSCGSRQIGVKKVLVFYKGKPQSGLKMDWIMTEYRLPDTSRPLRSRGSMRLDDWVLCRIRQKGNKSKNEQEDEQNSCEFRESNVKELPSVCVEDSRDMLADYLQSSEHHLIVSLLIGHDPEVVPIPRTTFQSHKSGNSSRTIHEDRSGKMNTQEHFSLFQSSSDSEPGQSKEQNSYRKLHTNTIMNDNKDVAFQSGQLAATMCNKLYCQHVPEGYKCKLNYPSNAYINLQELDMPALQEDFLQ